jgi:uncharacterized SAM-binding protein YcdF (DUF218 family)
MKIIKAWKKAVLILGLIIFLSWISLLAKIYYYSDIDNRKKADSILVLGASQWNGEPSPVFKSRLDHAYGLYRDGYAGNIILTGGIGEGEKISEAAAGKKYLAEKGTNDSNIFMEEKGRTSWQSLNEADKILKEHSFKSVILVSDGFHMMRLKKMTEDLGISSYGSPVKKGPVSNNWRALFKYAVRESVVYVLYLLFKI